jgi:hypothetical protein
MQILDYDLSFCLASRLRRQRSLLFWSNLQYRVPWSSKECHQWRTWHIPAFLKATANRKLVSCLADSSLPMRCSKPSGHASNPANQACAPTDATVSSATQSTSPTVRTSDLTAVSCRFGRHWHSSTWTGTVVPEMEKIVAALDWSFTITVTIPFRVLGKKESTARHTCSGSVSFVFAHPNSYWLSAISSSCCLRSNPGAAVTSALSPAKVCPLPPARVSCSWLLAKLEITEFQGTYCFNLVEVCRPGPKSKFRV